MRPILIISLLLVCAFSFSQTVLDSLKKQLPLLRDSMRIDCLNRMSAAYTDNLEKDGAEHTAKLAYEESEKLHYIHGIAMALAEKSLIAWYFYNDFGSMELLARTALGWYEKTNNKEGMDLAYNTLTFSLFSQSKYDEDYSYALEKYENCKKTGDQDGLYDALTTFAVIHYQKGNYDSSFHYYTMAEQLAVDDKNDIWLTSNLFCFGTLYRAIEDYPTALNYYRQGFERDNPENIKYRQGADWEVWLRMEYAELFALQQQFDSAWHYYSLFDTARADGKHLRIYLVSTGETLFLQKNYPLALQHFLRGLAYHKALSDRNEVKRTLLDIAKTYFRLNDNKAALQYAREGLDLSLETKSRQFIRDAYQILYSVYDRFHQVDSAYYYYGRYIAMKEAVVSDQTKGRFAARNYENKIELLNKERQINVQQLNLRNQQLKNESLVRNILMGGIFLVLLFGVIIVRNIILRNRNEKLQHERTQAELKQQSAELEMQALRAQMNPHFIFNCLNSINSFILNNETEPASDYLTKFSRLIRMVLVNSKSRLISMEDELDMLKLYLGMERLRFKNRFDYSIRFDSSVEAGNIFMPPLMIQPFVENAIWHGLMNKSDAEKGYLEIAFSMEGATLVCSITDNGIGRKAAGEINSRSVSKQKSMGLKITKERLASGHGNPEGEGSFEFEDLFDGDGRAAGTRVILRIQTKEIAESST